MSPRPPLTLIPLLALTLLAAGCEDGTATKTLTIGETRVAPRPVKPAEPLSMAERFGGAPGGPRPTGPVQPPAGPALELEHQAPAGWEAQPTSAMRSVNYRVPPDAECYVTLLPGRAGGLAENLNRWRKQMGQAPLNQEDLAQLPQRSLLGVSGVEVTIDGTFSGMGGAPQEGYRLRGVVASFQGQSVFVKFVGPRATVEAGGAAFEAFCASLQPRGVASQPESTGPVGPPARTDALEGLSWKTPAGWKEVASSSSMRLLTFSLPERPQAECYLTVLNGSGGGEAANLERWQGQLGLPALGTDGLAKLTRVQVLGREVALFEGVGTYSAMAGGAQAQTYLAGCAIPVGDRTVFIKLVIPGAGAPAEREAFLSFLTSLRVGQ